MDDDVQNAIKNSNQQIEQAIAQQKARLVELEEETENTQRLLATLQGRRLQNDDISKYLTQRQAELSKEKRVEEPHKKAQEVEVVPNEDNEE